MRYVRLANYIRIYIYTHSEGKGTLERFSSWNFGYKQMIQSSVNIEVLLDWRNGLQVPVQSNCQMSFFWKMPTSLHLLNAEGTPLQCGPTSSWSISQHPDVDSSVSLVRIGRAGKRKKVVTGDSPGWLVEKYWVVGFSDRVLCLTCFIPMREEYCISCVSSAAQKWGQEYCLPLLAVERRRHLGLEIHWNWFGRQISQWCLRWITTILMNCGAEMRRSHLFYLLITWSYLSCFLPLFWGSK